MGRAITKSLLVLVCLLIASAANSQSTGPAEPVSKTHIMPITQEVMRVMLEQPWPERFVPGQMIVKLKPTATLLPQSEMSAMGFETAPRPTSGDREFIYNISPTIIGPLSTLQAINRTKEMLRTMLQRPDIEYAQLNYYYQIQVRPNDVRFSEQWHYFDRGAGNNESPGGIGLPTKWDSDKGSPNIVVAVIDTGILPNHADIAGSSNLIAGYDMISNSFIGNDGDGRDNDPTDPGDAMAADDCFPGSPARSSSWHGTHVAGTIGVGRTNNRTGVAGVNWDVSLQAVRVLGKCGGTSADINDAIRWAAGLAVPNVPNNATPARVINMSLGGGGSCSNAPATQSAINDAVNAGTTVVVAAGNSAQDAANFQPASCDNVITVAASDYRGHLVSRYSNFGDTVEIMAPGGDVSRDDDGDGNPDGVLSMIQGGYAYYNGTSMASPHAAGVAALLLSEDPSRTPQQIAQLIKDSAVSRSTTQCPEKCGAGLLSASAAVPPPGVQLRISPSALSLGVGVQGTVTATLTQGGQPLAGKTVAFSSASSGIARVLTSNLTTDSAGDAKATVEGVAAGNATVSVTAAGASKMVAVSVTAPVVSALSPWSLLLIMCFMLTVTYRRLRQVR